MKRIIPFLAAAALTISACGGDDDGSVKVDDAWARPTASGQTNGAVYFDITSFSVDRLVGASVDPSVAAEAQIHEVIPADLDEMSEDMDMSEGSGDMDSSGDAGDHEMDTGAMTMQEVADGIELPEDQTVSFDPGGYHVMLLELAAPLEEGDEIEVTLSFTTTDDVTFTAEVTETAP
jgi:copper(I)-binding protein